MAYDQNIRAIPSCIEKARTRICRTSPPETDLSSLQHELRIRRQSYIGSHISLRGLLSIDGIIHEETVEEVSRYLSVRAAHLWRYCPSDGETFAFRFFRLVIHSIIGPKESLRRENVDNIIHFADCLIRSRESFVIAVKDLAPPEHIGEAFEFLEAYDDSYLTPNFEDAVLGAVAIMLGALSDPFSTSSDSSGMEANV